MVIGDGTGSRNVIEGRKPVSAEIIRISESCSDTRTGRATHTMGALSVPSLSLPLPSMTTTRDRAQEGRKDMNHRPLSNLERCVRCNVILCRRSVLRVGTSSREETGSKYGGGQVKKSGADRWV